MTALVCLCTALGAAIASAALIVALRPLLARYALARPNARSSHSVPTPQGGGVAVVAAALASAGGALAWSAGSYALEGLLIPLGGALVLAVLGGVDDVRPLSATLRLVVQGVCVAAVVAGDQARLFPEFVPVLLEFVLLTIAGIWWVNLVNFMDGIDWLTVAEALPLTGTICLLGLAGPLFLPLPVVFVAAGLFGGLLGFAPANRPVARLFLGDVGSLPIGLLTGWMLLALARSGAPAAAILLPLYYAADATVTLLARLSRRERIWEAHRSHYYQRARDNGFTVLAIDGRVFGLNLVLAALAAATIRWPSPIVATAMLLAGGGLVAWQLRTFAAPRSNARP